MNKGYIALLGILALFVFITVGVNRSGVSQDFARSHEPFQQPVASLSELPLHELSWPANTHTPEQETYPKTAFSSDGPNKVTLPTRIEALTDSFLSLLLDYRHHQIEAREKHAIYGVLIDLNSSPEGRQLIADSFFTENTVVAETLYNLLLDADIKDSALLVDLIKREQTENLPEYRVRILDLIADLNTKNDTPYQVEIDAFLGRLALHSDQGLRAKAISQRAWYVRGKNLSIAPIIGDYLLDHSPAVREEMYEIIELTIANPDDAQKHDIALSLIGLLYADYLGLKDQEMTRVLDLLARLKNSG
ncbi:MAG: hypothetical protein H7A01_13870 [Hahellaceae bacterium]|nr:hypothetical protein [Hahellaceae bacterium]MCP5209591.1 hypothetical protein [Hahellaceae bacterium]